MALGIMQGIGEQIGAMAGGGYGMNPRGYFGSQGMGLRAAFSEPGGGVAGAYSKAKHWLGIGYGAALESKGSPERLLPWLGTIGEVGEAGRRHTEGFKSNWLYKGAGSAERRAFGMMSREAKSIFRRRQIASGIGGAAGLVAAGQFVGYGNMLKGGGMWAGGSVIGGALGATAAFGGNAAAGRRIGGRVGLGIYGGYKAGKWAGRKLGMW